MMRAYFKAESTVLAVELNGDTENFKTALNLIGDAVVNSYAGNAQHDEWIVFKNSDGFIVEVTSGDVVYKDSKKNVWALPAAVFNHIYEQLA